jgi:predicted amidophosphoribosyltransferase
MTLHALLGLLDSRLLGELRQLFWPARCAGCDDYISDPLLFCPDCALSITPLADVCPGCALPRAPPEPPMPGREEGRPCQRQPCHPCRRAPFAFAEAGVACEYGAALADAIVAMKHRGRRDLAPRLARLMVEPLARVLERGDFRREDAIVPVPLHPRKLRRRGFNQALELGRAALGQLRRQAGPKMAARLPALERSLLLRTRDTRELGHLGPFARLQEVAGAFAVADPARVRGRRVLLIDDVFTTGATLNECAGVLRAAGEREVRVVAVARAL